jgi:hypothetical protein
MDPLPFPPMPISDCPPLTFSKTKLIALKNIMFEMRQGSIYGKTSNEIYQKPPQPGTFVLAYGLQLFIVGQSPSQKGFDE